MLVLEEEVVVEAGHAFPTLAAILGQNLNRQESFHGYYGQAVPCSAFPGRWAAYSADLEPHRWILSVQSMLVLKQPNPLDLDLGYVEKTASIVVVIPAATEARAVLPGPTSLPLLCLELIGF